MHTNAVCAWPEQLFAALRGAPRAAFERIRGRTGVPGRARSLALGYPAAGRRHVGEVGSFQPWEEALA